MRDNIGLVVMASLMLVGTVEAQQSKQCAILCAPDFTLMPGVIRTHAFRAPRVRELPSNQVVTLPGKSSFELIGAFVAPTHVTWASLFASVQWLPNAKESANPYTLYTASDVGQQLRANAPSVTMGVSLALLAPTLTHGWFTLDGNIGDLFSQAAEPDDESSYSHKLDLDLVGTLHPFSELPKSEYLHRVGVYGILDFVATGLPKAGDQIPKGERVFLDDARSISLIVGLSLPIAPLAPSQ
ncbi:MAG: hypothetical protein ACJ796_15275 [Gemmatimonadaceae bacterium]